MAESSGNIENLKFISHLGLNFLAWNSLIGSIRILYLDRLIITLLVLLFCELVLVVFMFTFIN